MPWQNLSEPATASPSTHKVPRVTAAAKPFENMIPPSGYLYDELLKDPAYQHAVHAGLLWQSLCSQHVHFPALWYDRDQPARPPMGFIKKVMSKKHHSKWHYYGRHRVANEPKLNRLIGNRGSSGRLLLHLMVVDKDNGSHHPGNVAFSKAQNIEALLQHYNRGFVEATPLGGAGSKQQDMLNIDNANLKAVFGARPPLFTRFVPEEELYAILSENVRTNVPASIVLMRHFLQEEEM
ncbi:MAG: hypothetical protein SGARI_004093 [Bacillariaceae sp.]